MSDKTKKKALTKSKDVQAKPVAIIDIGSTMVRLAIAEIDDDGNIRPLEFLQRVISLGKDTFIRGAIERERIEECVHALKSFRKVLEEYQIIKSNQIRAVATTAVCEASNRDVFINRMYIAAGIHVDAIEPAEVLRLTYLSFYSTVKKEPKLLKSDLLITELGGGSLQTILLQSGNVSFSNTYRLGSLRLRQMLETFKAPVVREKELMASNIQRTINQFRKSLPDNISPKIIALGGDARFAYTQLIKNKQNGLLAKISLSDFTRFTESILSLSVNELVKKYHLPIPEAETIGPTLLTYVLQARSFKQKYLYISQSTMREGLLMEMAQHKTWTENFRKQIVLSALKIGRQYNCDEAHAKHVAQLSRHLFHDLEHEHFLEPWYELLLTIASLLHDIGMFISNRSHHKHSLYLIKNSELFGLSQRDKLLVALVARYHRRASPKPTHPDYFTLDQRDKMIVMKLAAILRTADALDRSNSQRINNIQCSCENNKFIISIPNINDLTLERLAIKQKGPLFEEVFGMNVELQTVES